MRKAQREALSSGAICLAARDEQQPIVRFKTLSGSRLQVYVRTVEDGCQVLDIVRINRASLTVEYVQTCVQPEEGV